MPKHTYWVLAALSTQDWVSTKRVPRSDHDLEQSPEERQAGNEVNVQQIGASARWLSLLASTAGTRRAGANRLNCSEFARGAARKSHQQRRIHRSVDARNY